MQENADKDARAEFERRHGQSIRRRDTLFKMLDEAVDPEGYVDYVDLRNLALRACHFAQQEGWLAKNKLGPLTNVRWLILDWLAHRGFSVDEYIRWSRQRAAERASDSE